MNMQEVLDLIYKIIENKIMKTEILKEFLSMLGKDATLENASLLSAKLQEMSMTNSAGHSDLLSLFIITLGSGPGFIKEIKSIVSLREQADESNK